MRRSVWTRLALGLAAVVISSTIAACVVDLSTNKDPCANSDMSSCIPVSDMMSATSDGGAVDGMTGDLVTSDK